MLQHEVKANVGNEEQRRVTNTRIAIIRQLEPAALAATNFIVNAQSPNEGSWGYDPGTDGTQSILGGK